MKNAEAINHLKNLQLALREVISEIDKIQLSLTELPPPQLGPPPKVRGVVILQRASKNLAARVFTMFRKTTDHSW